MNQELAHIKIKAANKKKKIEREKKKIKIFPHEITIQLCNTYTLIC